SDLRPESGCGHGRRVDPVCCDDTGESSGNPHRQGFDRRSHRFAASRGYIRDASRSNEKLPEPYIARSACYGFGAFIFSTLDLRTPTKFWQSFSARVILRRWRNHGITMPTCRPNLSLSKARLSP